MSSTNTNERTVHVCPNARLIKWQTCRPDRLRSIAERLSNIRERPPLRVPRLEGFGWAGNTLRLEHERVSGQPLQTIAHELPAGGRQWLRRELAAQCALWKTQRFIHGDLSPRNILVEWSTNRAPTLWFIDWVTDLSSHCGTPLFAAPEVFHGKRSASSDQYAIERILSVY